MTISSEIIEVLEYLCMKFGIVIDWTSDNVIPYVQTLCEKFIAWEIATSVMWIVIGCVLMVIGTLLVLGDCLSWETVGISIVGMFLFFGGLSVVGVQVYDLITCKYFPELKLFNYLKVYINQG